MNTQPKPVMFYFERLEQMRDFGSFRVEAVFETHKEAEQSGRKPAWYSVIGQFRPDVQFQYPEFPVADFPCENYAKLFAEMCEQYITDQAIAMTA